MLTFSHSGVTLHNEMIHDVIYRYFVNINYINLKGNTITNEWTFENFKNPQVRIIKYNLK